MDEADRYRRGLARLRELGGPLGAFQEAAAGGPRVAHDLERYPRRAAPLGDRLGPGRPDRRGASLPPPALRRAGRDLAAGVRVRRQASRTWSPATASATSASTHPRTRSPWQRSRPIATEAGPVAFPIDWEAVSWLWSLDGYPSDPVHTDFHRESLRGARVWSIGGEIRDPEAGAARAREQAREFLAAISERLAGHRERTGSEGLVVFAIDTELLGHWWWEGPEWLAEVVASAEGAGVELVTLAERSGADRARGARHPPLELGRAQGPLDLGLARRCPTSPGARDASSYAWCASWRLGISHPSARSGPRASSWLSRRATGRFSTSAGQAGDYPFVRVTDHARAMLDAIHSAPAPAPELRNLAPDLSLAPLTAP